MLYKEFDSDVLGMRVGQAENLEDLALVNSYDYVYIKLHSSRLESIQTLEQHGFRISDISQTYYLLVSQSFLGEPLDNPRPYRDSDLLHILNLTSWSFYMDRFHRDFYLSKDLADKVYKQWVTNACNGKYGDAVFVEESKSGISGFSVCRIENSEVGHIDLTTVNQLERSNGLIAKDIAFFRNRGIKYVLTSTQIDNTASRKSLSRLGFKEHDSYITMSWRQER